ncbi:hypothetical protein F5Y19DRAFT_420587 [Xylariaceae sp. FL1651]|nr:hypothetical protein F5Y19DRAFT_420587 [Xylariaceae sp. FL1651]
MGFFLDAMCPKTKTKTKTKKTSKKRECHECTARQTARDEVNQMMFSPLTPHPMVPPPMRMMNQNQLGYNYGFGYGYGDWSAWEDHYPAMVSKGQWKDHTQTAKKGYDSSQENGRKIDDTKDTITKEIREAQNAIKEAHNSVDTTEASVKDTYVAVTEAQNAIKKTQKAIKKNYTAHMSKQDECAAEVTKVREYLEEEAKRREETRRMQQAERCQRWEREREREQLEQQQAQFAETMQQLLDEQRLLEEQERWRRLEEMERLERRNSYLRNPPPRPQGSHFDVFAAPPPHDAYPFAGYAHVGGGTGNGNGRFRGARPPFDRQAQPPPRHGSGNGRPWQN